MHNIIVIGTGGIGKRHIRGLIASKRAALTFVEPHPDRRAEATADYTPVASFARLEDANLHDYDLAVICTPAHVHVPIMQACVDHDLPFLVEKPLSISMDGIDDIIAAVRAKNLLARVGYIRRIAPEVLALRKQIQDGRIGDVKLAYINSSQEFPKYRPDYQTTYYAKPEMGGGAILDAATHPFDLLIWLMGKPVTVCAQHDRLALDGTQTEDTCLVTVRFESGAMANLTINQFQKRNVATMEFIGTKGNLMLDHSILRWTDNDGIGWDESVDFMDGLVPMQAHEARFGLQATTMLNALEGIPDTLATLEDARMSLALALAAKQSGVEKRFVDITM